MIKTLKQIISFFVPIIYLIVILCISLIYFTGQKEVDYNSNGIFFTVVSRKDNPFQNKNIKEIRVEAGGSQFLFNWRNRPVLSLTDGVKRPIKIDSYEVTESGYQITFNHDIVLLFTGAKDALNITLVIPPELDDLITALSIPWQVAKGFRLSEGDNTTELHSDNITYYIKYSDSSVMIDPIKKRANFIAFNSPSFSLTANSYGAIGTLDDFLDRADNWITIDENLYYYEIAKQYYNLLYRRFDSVSGLFYDRQGTTVYNEKAMLLLLATAHATESLAVARSLLKPAFDLSNRNATMHVTPYTGYIPVRASSSSRIAYIRAAIRNSDSTIFEAYDLLNFMVEENLYSLRPALVSLASKISEDESSLLTAQKLYFMISMLKEMPQRERTASELQLTSRLLSHLLSQVVWLKSNLYLYHNNNIALHAAIVAAYCFDSIITESLIIDPLSSKLQEVAFYLRKGSLEALNKEGYLPNSEWWEGTVATASDQLIALEEIGPLLWPVLLYPSISNQRNFLQPETNIFSLAKQIRTIFLDRAKRLIQLDITLEAPENQYIVVSNLSKVSKVVTMGNELAVSSDSNKDKESWLYDSEDRTLLLHLQYRGDLPARYLIYLEAPLVIPPPPVVVSSPVVVVVSTPAIVSDPVVEVDDKVTKKRKNRKKD